jgi:hypothetical protein
MSKADRIEEHSSTRRRVQSRQEELIGLPAKRQRGLRQKKRRGVTRFWGDVTEEEASGMYAPLNQEKFRDEITRKPGCAASSGSSSDPQAAQG